MNFKSPGFCFVWYLLFVLLSSIDTLLSLPARIVPCGPWGRPYSHCSVCTLCFPPPTPTISHYLFLVFLGVTDFAHEVAAVISFTFFIKWHPYICHTHQTRNRPNPLLHLLSFAQSAAWTVATGAPELTGAAAFLLPSSCASVGGAGVAVLRPTAFLLECRSHRSFLPTRAYLTYLSFPP